MSLSHLSSPDPEPTVSIEWINPELAERYLAKNIRNRKMKWHKRPEFARAMSAGAWELTGEAIKFGIDGSLLDGQTRLGAIIDSGCTVQMFVVRGIKLAAQEVMDSGTPRSAADALHLRGYKNGKDLAATVNCYVGWRTGFFAHAMHQSAVKLSHREVLDVATEHPNLYESVEFGSRFRRALPLPVGALATAHFAIVAVDPDDAAEFFNRIIDLRTEGRGDPVHILVKRVAEARERRERIWPATGLFYLFRSWNACRAGEPLQKFQLGSPLRGWVPIPEPK